LRSSTERSELISRLSKRKLIGRSSTYSFKSKMHRKRLKVWNKRCSKSKISFSKEDKIRV